MDTKEIWDNITREELLVAYCEKGWYDTSLAEAFGVSRYQVRYKRRKFGIREVDKRVFSIMHVKNSLTNESLVRLNAASKAAICSADFVGPLSKIITHHIFRNGPVEDMHAAGKLSENDMMTLNKYMVNMLAGLLQNAVDGNWLALNSLFGAYKFFGTDWDTPVPDNSMMEDWLRLMVEGKYI